MGDHIELTDDDRRKAEESFRRTREAIAEAMKEPPVEIHNPGKFSQPLGLDPRGNLQPPLTPEEAAHNEAVRRRARGEVPGAD